MRPDADPTTHQSRRRWAGLAGRRHGDANASRTPIVFLHGLTFDRRMWDPVLDALPPDQPAIAFDLPGHGESPALLDHGVDRVVDAIHAAVVAAGIEHPVVVGHSIGAAHATIYAATYPCDGVINVDKPPRVEPFARLVQSIAPRLQGGEFDAIWSTMFRSSMHVELVPDAYRPLLAPGEYAPQSLVLSYWADLLTRGPDRLAGTVDAQLEQIRAARIPYLTVRREPLELADEAWLLERLPDAEVLVWPVGHHFPHLADPVAFAALASSFVDDLGE